MQQMHAFNADFNGLLQSIYVQLLAVCMAKLTNISVCCPEYLHLLENVVPIAHIVLQLMYLHMDNTCRQCSSIITCSHFNVY